MAQLAILDERLMEAFRAGALTYEQAWAIQDLILLSPPESEEVELPDWLEAPGMQLQLFQAVPHNDLPL